MLLQSHQKDTSIVIYLTVIIPSCVCQFVAIFSIFHLCLAFFYAPVWLLLLITMLHLLNRMSYFIVLWQKYCFIRMINFEYLPVSAINFHTCTKYWIQFNRNHVNSDIFSHSVFCLLILLFRLQFVFRSDRSIILCVVISCNVISLVSDITMKKKKHTNFYSCTLQFG